MWSYLDGSGYWGLLGLVVAGTSLLTAVGLALGYAAQAFAQRRGRTIYAVAPKRGQLRTEILGTALFHAVFAPIFALALHAGLIRFDGSGIVDGLLSFGVPWFGFQFFYYFMHRGLHHRALFFMHRWHHESLVTSPMTGFSMHPLEALGWTAGAVAPLSILTYGGHLAPFGFALFAWGFWVGNIVGHANADLFPMRIGRWLAVLTPPIIYHSLHHARFDGHYGFAAASMDRLFGTEWPDWEELHQRTHDGHALTSLRDSGAASPGSPLDP